MYDLTENNFDFNITGETLIRKLQKALDNDLLTQPEIDHINTILDNKLFKDLKERIDDSTWSIKQDDYSSDKSDEFDYMSNKGGK